MLTSDLLKSRSDRLRLAPLLGATLAMVLTASTAAAPLRTDLSKVQSWGYQLQQVDPDLVAASDYDLMVVDYSRDGSAERAFSAAEIALMKRKADGGTRVVLAYLSIGEAEDYRFYWQQSWAQNPPDWLGAENPDWPGNYTVRYWLPDWQSVIFGTPDSYLDAVIKAGFDGVYLDRIDSFEEPVAGLNRQARMAAMSQFVDALARYAREQHPGFVVVGQNGEELLADATYAEAIDGVGKEDLFFGLEGDGARNSRSQLRASLTPLQAFQRAGKPVFVIEYLDSADAMTEARSQAAALGSPLFIGNRELDDVRSR